MDINTLSYDLTMQGFAVVRGMLSPEEVNHYVGEMEKLSNVNKANYTPGSAGRGFGKAAKGSSWSLPDGVTKTEAFWPIIWHEKLLQTVRALLGEDDIRFLQHTDLHIGFSAISWHRDNVARKYGTGPDWDESTEPYKIVRVGIYLQTFEESNFRLGFIKRSHRFNPETQGFKTWWREKQFEVQGLLSYVIPNIQERATDSEWVPTEPGDCIIFDPRAIHSGSYIKGPKYSMFVAYGVPNIHFYNHLNYYRNVRPELGYREPPEALVAELKARGLYADVPMYSEIDGAWTPTPLLRNMLDQRFNKKPQM